MAKSERSGKIQTVLGLIEPEQLEVTITHITACCLGETSTLCLTKV